MIMSTITQIIYQGCSEIFSGVPAFVNLNISLVIVFLLIGDIGSVLSVHPYHIRDVHFRVQGLYQIFVAP